jgi:hypothetical protein
MAGSPVISSSNQGQISPVATSRTPITARSTPWPFDYPDPSGHRVRSTNWRVVEEIREWLVWLVSTPAATREKCKLVSVYSELLMNFKG